MARRNRTGKGRFRPKFTADAPQRTLAEYVDAFKKALAGSNVPPVAVATAVADLAQTLDSTDIRSERGPTLFAMATALKTAIDFILEPYPLVWPLLKNDDAGLKAALQAEGVEPDDFRGAEHGTPEAVAPAIRFATWLLTENQIYQAAIVNRVVHTLVILGLKGFGRLQQSPERTDELFRDGVGLSGYEYVLTLFGVWAKARVDSLIDLETFLPPQTREPQHHARLRALVEALSMRFDEFRDISKLSGAGSYSGKALACAYFSRWPLIQLNDTRFMSAGHPFLKIQIGTKSMTKALALARVREGRGSTEYSGWLGRRLEAYFAELCELWRPGDHFGEYEYLNQGNELSPDRIIFEQHGSKLVCCLFQLKLKMLSEASHFGASSETMQRDLASASETIYRTIKFLVRAAQADAEGELRPESALLTRKILSADKFCFVGIVPDMPAIFVFRELREQLVQEVMNHLQGVEREWFDRNFQSKCLWHVMDLDEFEFFLGLPPKHRELFKRLTGYFRDAGVNGPLTAGGRVPQNFRSYLISKFGDENPETGARRLMALVPGLSAIYEQMVEDVKLHFRFGEGHGPT
jgi:hypothetical protein